MPKAPGVAKYFVLIFFVGSLLPRSRVACSEVGTDSGEKTLYFVIRLVLTISPYLSRKKAIVLSYKMFL